MIHQFSTTTKTLRFGRTAGMIAVLLGSFASSAFADKHKLSQELQNSTSSNRVDVIVQYSLLPGLLQKTLAQGHSGKLGKDLPLVNALHVSLPANQAAALSNDPGVVYVSPDRPLLGTLNNSAPAVNAPYAWAQGYDASGIGVAVIDSGIGDKQTAGFKKSDLNKYGTGSSRVSYAQSWVNDGNGTLDVYGHGTHVAGIIAGNGYNSTGAQFTQTFKGIAANANIINLRVLDGNGQGTDSSVIDAINTAILLKLVYNIRVINLSLGRPVYESYTLDPLCQAVEAAYRAGIVVVVAAGNNGRDNTYGTNGYATITAPGNDPYVITVGAMKSMGTPTREDDQIASYSSKGPTLIDHIAKPDIVAPGNKVVSILAAPGAFLATHFTANTVPQNCYTASGATSGSMAYFALSGTSMATPVVSGAAAILLQQHPLLTPDQVKARLMKTATKSFPPLSTVTDPATGSCK